MSETIGDILREAVARNSTTVLSLPVSGSVRHHKSRFLRQTTDGVWLESIPAERAAIETLHTAGQPCGVSFKNGVGNKVSFVAKVLKLDDAFPLGGGVIPAVLLAPPIDLKAVQRRNNHRVRVSEDSGLRVQMWRIPDYVRLKDKPQRTDELAFRLHDISIGGIGIAILSRDGQPPRAIAGERVRVLIRFEHDEEFLVEARMRPPRGSATPDEIHTGVQFVRLEDKVEGRQILSDLTRIIGVLQLEHVRRQKLGIA